MWNSSGPVIFLLVLLPGIFGRRSGGGRLSTTSGRLIAQLYDLSPIKTTGRTPDTALGSRRNRPWLAGSTTDPAFMRHASTSLASSSCPSSSSSSSSTFSSFCSLFTTLQRRREQRQHKHRLPSRWAMPRPCNYSRRNGEAAIVAAARGPSAPLGELSVARKAMEEQQKLNYLENMLCGGLSRAAAQALCHPLNVAKTLLQARGPGSADTMGGVWGIVRGDPSRFPSLGPTQGSWPVHVSCVETCTQFAQK